MAKQKAKKRPTREMEIPLEERAVEALERIAEALDDLVDAAVYENKGVRYVGVSINHDPDVMGDDTFSPNGQEEDEDEEEEDEQ